VLKPKGRDGTYKLHRVIQRIYRDVLFQVALENFGVKRLFWGLLRWRLVSNTVWVTPSGTRWRELYCVGKTKNRSPKIIWSL